MVTSIGGVRIVPEIGGRLYNTQFMLKNQVSACGIAVGGFTVNLY